MVNFACQLDLTTGMSRYLVEHFSGCVCEGFSDVVDI